MIFCSDIDNTLIYSYKHEIGRDKILIETLHEKELAYMTADAFLLLQKIAGRIYFVPVTTRSIEQYRRINFGSQIKLSYALTSNGGILIKGGRVDENWKRDTLAFIEPALSQLEKGVKLLKQDPDVFLDVKRVDGLFLYTKSQAPDRTMLRLQEALNPGLVSVCCHGSKLYIFPNELNKGAAVKRLSMYLKDADILASGDSELDIPMLLYAQEGFCPDSLNFKIPTGAQINRMKKSTFTIQMLAAVWRRILAE